MKTHPRLFSAAIGLVLTGFLNSAQAGDPNVVRGFMSICMNSLGDELRGVDNAKSFGLTALDGLQKAEVLRKGAGGSALEGAGMTVTIERNGMCTVFARVDDPKAIHDALKKELPPPTTPFKVNVEQLQGSPDTLTTVYHLVLPTRPFADWIFSAYEKPGRFNVAITMQLKSPI